MLLIRRFEIGLITHQAGVKHSLHTFAGNGTARYAVHLVQGRLPGSTLDYFYGMKAAAAIENDFVAKRDLEECLVNF